MLSGQKPCFLKKKNSFESLERICDFIPTHPPTNCEGAKLFEVCHVQSIINHRKSGIISTSIFRSLETGWCQLALINLESGRLLCLLFVLFFPVEIFKQ